MKQVISDHQLHVQKRGVIKRPAEQMALASSTT